MAQQKRSNGDQLGFEAKLWQTADKLRNNMDAAGYKHVVLGLIFLKYISDAFEELHAKLQVTKGADPEDPAGQTYESMNIKEGDEASRMFVEVFVKGQAEKDKDKIRKDLEDYCQLDTQAMIDIVKKLNGMVQ